LRNKFGASKVWENDVEQWAPFFWWLIIQLYYDSESNAEIMKRRMRYEGRIMNAESASDRAVLEVPPRHYNWMTEEN
jgi:hypothetical protein